MIITIETYLDLTEVGIDDPTYVTSFNTSALTVESILCLIDAEVPITVEFQESPLNVTFVTFDMNISPPDTDNTVSMVVTAVLA